MLGTVYVKAVEAEIEAEETADAVSVYLNVSAVPAGIPAVVAAARVIVPVPVAVTVSLRGMFVPETVSPIAIWLMPDDTFTVVPATN